MKRLGMLIIAFLCVLLLLSGLVNKVSFDLKDGTNKQVDSFELQGIDHQSWRDVISKIKAYRPQKSKAEIAAEKRRLAELAKRKQRKIEDAVLVGTVINERSKALLVLPGKNEPEELSIGDTWLEPWTLFAVYSDYVVWQNADNNSKKQQALFK